MQEPIFESESQIIDLDLTPRPGISLMSAFVAHLAAHHQDQTNPDRIVGVDNIRFRIHAYRYPYRHIIDFNQRLPSVKEATGIKEIELVYQAPEQFTYDRIDNEMKRVLRSLDDGQVWVDPKGNVQLSNTCVVDLLTQLHLTNLRLRNQLADVSLGKTVTDLGYEPVQGQGYRVWGDRVVQPRSSHLSNLPILGFVTSTPKSE